MAFVGRKVITATNNIINIGRRSIKSINEISINNNVFQCFKELFGKYNIEYIILTHSLMYSIINMFLDLSESQIRLILVKNRKLNLLQKESIVESIQVLRSFHIDESTILEDPSVLLIQGKFLKTHGKILLECGFPRVKTDILIG